MGATGVVPHVQLSGASGRGHRTEETYKCAPETARYDGAQKAMADLQVRLQKTAEERRRPLTHLFCFVGDLKKSWR